MRRAARSLVLATMVTTLVAGCQDWRQVSQRPEPQVKRLGYRHDVAFAPGTGDLSQAEQEQLTRFLGDIGVDDEDRVVIVGPDTPTTTSERRRQIVSSFLLLQGVAVRPRTGDLDVAAAADDAVAVVVERHAVEVPGCPDWSSRPNINFSNQPANNWGCSTAVNFGVMVAAPRDLKQGRDPGDADGTVSARAVERYRQGKTKDLIRDAASAETFPSAEGGE
jgi:pilus assembly protein CpaD